MLLPIFSSSSDKSLVSKWPPLSEIGNASGNNLRVIPCGSRKKPNVGVLCRGLEESHGRIVAWAWHGKCESARAALCKSNEDTFYTLSGTAWQGNSMGAAWARHARCEIALRLPPALANLNVRDKDNVFLRNVEMAHVMTYSNIPEELNIRLVCVLV